MSVRLVLTGLLAFACAAAAAQNSGEAPPPDGEAAKPAVGMRSVPRVQMPLHPRRAEIFRRTKVIDIPQWAKDAGHNGSVTYRVVVTADGAADKVQLIGSSGSTAIDQAALGAIRSASFVPATDKDGNPVAGMTSVYSKYTRWEDESRGGIRDYRCGDLIREYDWFREAHGNAGPPYFALENYYVSRDMLANVEGVDRRDRKAVEKQREKYTGEWLGVVEGCRKTPGALLLDKIKDPQSFQDMAGSF
ncbi:energy transducer TonB [Sphingopyxis sp. PET50]|uniref:energy transducer TonB n=1 Tax=Sphingopyxis sp. PET50 TaxID=2976533 RepID=UPI0021AE6680|nr:energy transducer TonB [Sphingopyxis sp. PET50]